MAIKLIQVYGTACPSCKKLFETVTKVAQDLGLKSKLEYITDVSSLLAMGFISSPVLVVDGKVIFSGGGKSEDEITSILENEDLEEDKTVGSCACCH